jgi:hypothetical protein
MQMSGHNQDRIFRPRERQHSRIKANYAEINDS